MAKITMAPRIKNSSDIVGLVRSYGIDLKKVGNLYWGLCPFHPDRHPSFTVYPETDSFFCFGCGKGGDKIEFIKLMENCNFKEAQKRLGLNDGTIIIRHQLSLKPRPSTLREELEAMERVLERILVRSLIKLDKQLANGQITLCEYYTQRAIAEDRLAEFDALRAANHYYLRNWE